MKRAYEWMLGGLGSLSPVSAQRPIYVAVHGTSLSGCFPPGVSPTLKLVAQHFQHDVSTQTIRVKMRCGEFGVVPLDLPLSRLRQLKADGDGSQDRPFCVLIERPGAVGAGASGAVMGAAGGAGATDLELDSPQLQEDLRWLTNEFGKVYSSLTPHSAEDQFIRFGDKTLHRYIPRTLRSSLYVRPLFWELLDKLDAYDERDGTVVTGNPGVGKSAFAALLIAFLAHRRRPVLYRYKAFVYETLLLMDFSKDPFECRIADFSAMLLRQWTDQRSGAWVIWDGNAPSGQHDKSRRVVVLSSPKEGSWNEFTKSCRLPQPLWLDMWSLQELQACVTLKNERKDFQVDASRVMERFRLFGGIPRYVLEQATVTVDEVMQKIKRGD